MACASGVINTLDPLQGLPTPHGLDTVQLEGRIGGENFAYIRCLNADDA